MSLKNVFIFFEGTDDDAHRAARERTGFWGEQAAGCLFYARDTGRLLISHRSDKVQEPNTWGTWGGAMDSGEDPGEAVRREVKEETGFADEVELWPIWIFQHESGFKYHNYLAVVPSEFEPVLDHETQGFEWVEPGDWPEPMHPGLKALVERPEFKAVLEGLR